jgi:hypothetical protein
MTNPRVIRLADLNPEPTLIDLDEHRYRLRQVTRSVQKNLDKALKALNATDESDDLDKQATALIDAVDVLLDPQDAAPRGGDLPPYLTQGESLELYVLQRSSGSARMTRCSSGPLGNSTTCSGSTKRISRKRGDD